MQPAEIVVHGTTPLRCPYCHDGVALEGAWTACGACLARHHPECWEDDGACASCRCKTALEAAGKLRVRVAVGPGTLRRSRRRSAARRRRFLVGGLAVASLLVNALLVVGFAVASADDVAAHMFTFF